jgi:hypothetical protein
MGAVLHNAGRRSLGQHGAPPPKSGNKFSQAREEPVRALRGDCHNLPEIMGIQPVGQNGFI